MLSHVFYNQQVPLYTLVNAFFLYSFMGWVMECIVIRREKGTWENRGFARSPFCIIYGFGAMIGYALLKPFAGNYIVLALLGAVLATVFEYLVARLMLRLFGTLWWDYSKKPFNYKGILCLESTVGWGFIAFILFRFLHNAVFGVVKNVNGQSGMVLAIVLVVVYLVDFSLSARSARQEKEQDKQELVGSGIHD